MALIASDRENSREEFSVYFGVSFFGFYLGFQFSASLFLATS